MDVQAAVVDYKEERVGVEACRTSRIYEIDPLTDPRWVPFVAQHPNASVFHSANWLKALKAEYAYKPIAFTTSSPGMPLANAILFSRVASWLTGHRLVSLPFSDHCEPLVNCGDELHVLLSGIRQHVDTGEYKYFELRPVEGVPPESTGVKESLVYKLHLLDLSATTEQLYRNFHKDCVQRKIRRAEREQLRYEEGRSEGLLREFYRLLVMTRRRQYLPPQPIGWFRTLLTECGEDVKIRVAFKGDKAIASILTLAHKSKMVYKYGCSDAALNNMGGTPLLFWRTIQEAKERGLAELDMGRSEIENSGLIAFKEHWGARGRLISYWKYPARTSHSRMPELNRLTKYVVTFSPNWALQTAGTLLYKHIG